MSRFTTPFGFHSTAAEVIAGVDLAGKRAIITGGAAGIGIETARVLSIAGAAVTLAVRRPDAAEAVAEELRQSTGNPAVDVKHLDLSDLRSVRVFTARTVSIEPKGVCVAVRDTGHGLRPESLPSLFETWWAAVGNQVRAAGCSLSVYAPR
jgi:NAD(P)-dependent dehydrogenase (short-subunit alcohol dehydrogenase family)